MTDNRVLRFHYRNYLLRVGNFVLAERKTGDEREAASIQQLQQHHHHFLGASLVPGYNFMPEKLTIIIPYRSREAG